MPDEVKERGELQIRRHHEARSLTEAVTLGLELYGDEIFGYLAALERSGCEAEEVFAAFAEALWSSLPRFRWDSSFRTWAYAIARYTLMQHRRRARTAALRSPPGDLRLEEIAERVRSSTAPHLRSSLQLRLEQLRAELDEDDHALLILRIDRQLSWREIAEIMRPRDQPFADEDAARRAAAALRKRFERLKAQLGSRLRAGRGL